MIVGRPKKPELSATMRRVRTYRSDFPERARRLAAAGITSNAQLATHFGATPQAVSYWKTQHPEFRTAVEGGLDEAILLCADVVLDAARQGDVNSARYFLDRRGEAFKPKSKVETSNAESLDERLKRRAMSEEEARAKGIIYDEDEPEPLDEGDRIDDDHEDEPPAAKPQAPRRRAISDGEADLRARGVLYDDDEDGNRKPAISVDPKRPYDFEKNRYR